MHDTVLNPSGSDTGTSPLRRELHVFALYRVLEGGLFVFMAYSPLAWTMLEGLRTPWLAHVAAPAYLALALALLALGRSPRPSLHVQVGLGLGVDIVAIGIAIHTLAGLETAAALLLVINIGAGALLMPLRSALVFAVVAALVVAGSYAYGLMPEATQSPPGRPLAEMVMFAAIYLAITVFCNLIGTRTRQAEALAHRRGEDVTSLADINELILRRMRTGVLVADANHVIRVANEAAWAALGHPPAGERALGTLAPELSRRLWHWRNLREDEDHNGNETVALVADGPEVIPYFTRLKLAGEELFLCFLDDTSLLSRRAEELTLRTLGRLSASIAHEIRNPLAAISHASQLVEESEGLSDADRRLLEIVQGQCTRLNGIINNVLGLARRERCRPERIDLVHWTREFVDEYSAAHAHTGVRLEARTELRRLEVQVDPQQLHQIASTLVSNAIAYGHLPGETPRVAMLTRVDASGAPLLEVVDRGPGIPDGAAQRLFEPFYTTSPHGTGLGLYVASELCAANQCSLVYASLPGGGSCFRIVLPHRTSLLRQRAG